MPPKHQPVAAPARKRSATPGAPKDQLQQLEKEALKLLSKPPLPLTSSSGLANMHKPTVAPPQQQQPHQQQPPPQIVVVHPGQPQAQQQPKAESSRPTVRAARKGWLPAIWKRLPRASSGLFLCIILIVFASGHQGALLHITRMLGATALVTESLSDLTATLLVRTSAMATSFFDTTASSLDVVSNAWHGIDLTQMKVQQVRGRVTAEDPDTVKEWIQAPAGAAVHLCDDHRVLAVWEGALSSLSLSMPSVQTQRRFLDAEGAFSSTSLSVYFLISGHVAFQYEFTNMSFQPRWANPLWEWLSAEVRAETPQIEALIQHVLSSLPQANFTRTELPDAEFSWSHPELWTAKWRRWRHWWYFTVAAWRQLAWYGLLWGLGILGSLTLGALAFRLGRRLLSGMPHLPFWLQQQLAWCTYGLALVFFYLWDGLLWLAGGSKTTKPTQITEGAAAAIPPAQQGTGSASSVASSDSDGSFNLVEASDSLLASL